LFEDLKQKYIENVEIFNKISRLRLEDGSTLLKTEDRSKMIQNVTKILDILNKHHEIIPNHNLKLIDLIGIDLNFGGESSPQLIESALQLENINTKIEES
jgi:hypothetical protein